MSRRRSVMSESFKNELAKDLGFYDVVQREGWEGIRTKDAGNMVKRAIQIAEEHLAKQYTSSPQSNYSQQPSYSSGYQQTGYAAPQQQSYSQMSNAPYPYASAPQAQSSYTTNFSPTSYSANTASTPVQSYQNPPPAGMAYIAGSEQNRQMEQRP